MVRSNPQRKELLKSIAAEILHNYRHGRILVAVDGRHGAGQKDFADGVAQTMMTTGVKVFRASMDDFFQPRAVRERAGDDGLAQYNETYDYSLLRRVLIDPFHTAGSTSFVLTGFDEVRDQPVFQPKWMSAGPDAIVILDGVFLHRPDLVGTWNYSIWLSTEPQPGADEEQAGILAADDAYLAHVNPGQIASATINNRDPQQPTRVFSDSC